MMSTNKCEKRKLKYEIIIEPEDLQYCGKCTYWERKKGHVYINKCLLFNKYLPSIIDPNSNNPERCGDCKLMAERFEKMPELDGGAR